MIQDCKNKNNPDLKQLASFLGVISEENRLRIVCFLLKSERCVCEIWKTLDLPQNLVSHHLKVLKEFGLLKSEKTGLRVCYCVDRKNLNKYEEALDLILSN